MSNETYVTIRGYAGADPMVFRNDAGNTTTVVRVGVTARNFDRKAGVFADGTTAWYSVRCYGELAENVIRSVRKGMPVLVRGRLAHRQWADKEGHAKTDLVIVSDSFGIDLNTGEAQFVRTRRGNLVAVEGEPAHAASVPGDSVDVGGEEPREGAEESKSADEAVRSAGNLARV